MTMLIKHALRCYVGYAFHVRSAIKADVSKFIHHYICRLHRVYFMFITMAEDIQNLLILQQLRFVQQQQVDNDIAAVNIKTTQKKEGTAKMMLGYTMGR